MIKLSSVLILLFISACNNHREQPSYRIHEKPLSPVDGTVAVPDEEPQYKVTRDNLLHGQKLYNRNCAVCHGLDGSGDSLPVRRGLTKPIPLYESEISNLYIVITNGKGRMPTFKKKLNPLERRMVVSYVEALKLSRRFPIQKLDEEDKEKIP